MRKLLAPAALIPLLLACAPFAASASPPLSPELRALSEGQRVQVAETCDQVMGLKSGGLYRQECMDSLARSLAAEAQGAQIAASYGLCSRQGLPEGTAAFSTCMLDNQERAGTVSLEPTKLAYGNNSQNSKSYFHVSNGEHWRREQYACAQLGLMPGTAPFGHCVASLDAALSPSSF